ncbi:MAG: 2-amino-4-hydroxy-6-hydroxymethyldihydropteridine diphosphokinase [Cytophagales bacterium]|nr:2-amino-4-hydroxy-6-hydroxymethyldihydropteridine diphosphokinase [Cytophagales bacterium]
MDGIYLLLGTNLGNKPLNLQRGKTGVEELMGAIIKQSSVYRTAAWGIENQHSFLNQVVKIKSELSPEQILEKIFMIEKSMGRVRQGKWSERIIDIDLLYYYDRIIDTHQLQVPHRELQNRNFTLVPLVEIAANEIHPVFHKTQKELHKLCKDRLEVVSLTGK